MYLTSLVFSSYHCWNLGHYLREVFQYWRDDSFRHLSQCWRVSLDRSNFRLYSNHVSGIMLIFIMDQSPNTHCRVALERNMSRQIRQCLVVSRVLFIVGIGLTVAGGALEGSDTDSDVLIGLKLVKAGYIIVVVFVGCLLAMQVYFWTQRSCLSVTSRTVSRPRYVYSFSFSRANILFPDSQRHSSGYTLYSCSHRVPLSVRIPAIRLEVE